MIKRNNRKGFTIVELVIVIAVIVVLAAVLIPTFAGIINKAKESADVQLVKQINDILYADAVVDGKHKTAHDAITTVSENGIDISKLTPTSDGRLIVWDSANDRFVLVEEEDGSEVFPDDDKTPANKLSLFLISDTYDTSKGYSIYLTDAFEDTSLSDVTTGIDVGNNTDITSVTYTGSEEVIIRTANKNCAFSMSQGTVNHYGIANNAEILGGVYNLYGTLYGTITAKGGAINVKNGATVAAILIDNPSSTVTLEPGSNVGRIAATDSSYLDNITNNTEKEVEIFEGVANATGLAKFDGGTGSEEYPYVISDQAQLINGINYVVKNEGYAEKTTYYSLGSDIELTSYAGTSFLYSVGNFFNSVLDGNGHTIALPTEEEISPFYQLAYGAEIKNVTFDNLKAPLAVYAYHDVTYDNVDVGSGKFLWGNNTGAYSLYSFADNITFVDCDAHFDFSGNAGNGGYNSVFVGYVSSSEVTLSFTNCTYSGTFVSGRTGMFVGNSYPAKTLNLIVSNCTNNGIIQSVYQKNNDYTCGWYNYGEGDVFNHFIASGVQDADSVHVINLTVDGTVYDMTEKNALRNTTSANWPTINTGANGKFIHGPSDGSLALSINENGMLVITQSEFHTSNNITKYKVAITSYGSIVDDEGAGTRFGIFYEIDASNFADGKYTTNLENLKFVGKEWIEEHSGGTLSTHKSIDGSGFDYEYQTYTFEGTTYYVVPAEEYDRVTLNGKEGSTDITVTAYTTDINGNDIIVSSSNLPK